MSWLFTSGGQSIGASVSACPFNENSGLIFFRIDWFDLLESLLDCKEIQPVHPKEDQSWVFIGRTDAKAETPILLPHDTKS